MCRTSGIVPKFIMTKTRRNCMFQEQMELFQDELMPGGLTSASAVFPVNRFLSRAKERDSKAQADSSLSISDFLKRLNPNGSSTKMSRECYLPKKEEILELSSMDFGNAGIMSHGECWTLNTCEWTDTLVPFLREDGVCSLSDILETGDIPLKYYLSRDACTGMLRRAERRGKKLPAVLEEALRRQAFAQ